MRRGRRVRVIDRGLSFVQEADQHVSSISYPRPTTIFLCDLLRTEMDTVIHADNDFATVAYLRIKNAILERKDEDYDEDIYVPPLLEDDLLGVRDAILLSQESSSSTPLDRQYDTSEELDLIESSSKTLESWFAVSNIHCDTQYLASERTVEDEAIECFRILEGKF